MSLNSLAQYEIPHFLHKLLINKFLQTYFGF